MNMMFLPARMAGRKNQSATWKYSFSKEALPYLCLPGGSLEAMTCDRRRPAGGHNLKSILLILSDSNSFYFFLTPNTCTSVLVTIYWSLSFEP